MEYYKSKPNVGLPERAQHPLIGVRRYNNRVKRALIAGVVDHV